MKMDQLKCHSQDGVLKELMVYVLVYNLVRAAMAAAAAAAARQGVSPERISFVDALRWLAARLPAESMRLVVNPNRPGRCCPRVQKRRPKAYPFMTRPRDQYTQPQPDLDATVTN